MGEVALLCQVISTRHLTPDEEKESIFDDYPFDIPLSLADLETFFFVLSFRKLLLLSKSMVV
jgi:hypothetical protein